MQQQLKQLVASALESIEQSNKIEHLEKVRVEYLGKKSHLTDLLHGLSKLSPEERPKIGQVVNEVKQEIQAAMSQRKEQLLSIELESKLAQEKLDVTLPGRRCQELANLHPVTQTRMRVEHIFTQLGFSIVEGPEIEDTYYNFSALNIPEHHPARAAHDTFYFPDGRVLRTHTSPVQIRTLEKIKPPVKIIAPGRVYRCDSDITHTPMFHQVEGLVVNEQATFAELKGLLHAFLEQFFQKKLQLRFRPSYFPFTEPSAEVDVECVECSGKGCRTCSDTGWLEILGCGMVHPNVLNSVNVDSKKYTGYAFGIGIDRLTMLYYQVNDLRLFFENDLRFLRQF